MTVKTHSSGMTLNPTRPVMRYHGGKWKLAPWIISHFPAHTVYVEPFGGGASVLMRKSRSHGEVYNDINQEVVDLFRVLRDPGLAAKLQSAIELTPYSRIEWESSYEPTADPVERARRLLVRSHMGHGSAAINPRHCTGFRADSRRCGTVPARDWANKSPSLAAAADRLRGVTIECRPAVDVIRAHDANDVLFYVDPPYVLDTRDCSRRGIRQTYQFDMTDEDHRSLAATLHAVAGMVVLSGYPSDLYNELYRDWTTVTTDAFADGARARTEVLWINAACKRALEHAHKQMPIEFGA